MKGTPLVFAAALLLLTASFIVLNVLVHSHASLSLVVSGATSTRQAEWASTIRQLRDIERQVKNLNSSLLPSIRDVLNQQPQLHQQLRQHTQAPKQHHVSQSNTSATQGHHVQQPGHQQLLVHHAGQARSACDNRGGVGLRVNVTADLVAPLVVVAHNRVHYLAKCLVLLLRYWIADEANSRRFPLYVSVDGGDMPTMQFVSALNFGSQVQLIHNLRDLSRCKPNDGYCNLALHYQMLLQLFLDCHQAPRVLFLEEDLEVAPDFFSYFTATAPLLDLDTSVWCISAWNDHGQMGRASNTTALYRTDVFPGLGWMTKAAIGKELYPKWPTNHWDHFLREPFIRKNRQCVFPEVPRTHTFGVKGTSSGQFFSIHLSTMILNTEDIDWQLQDLTYLQHGKYAALLDSWMAAADQVDGKYLGHLCQMQQGKSGMVNHRDLVVTYSNLDHFKRLALQLSPMMTDLMGASGLPGNDRLAPRGSYNGTVVVRCAGRRLFIAPATVNATMIQRV